MKKQKKILACFLACMMLAGCGGGNQPGQTETRSQIETPEEPSFAETEAAAKTENIWETAANGDRIDYMLTDSVSIKAVLEIPEEGLEEIPVIHAKRMSYSAETYRSALGIEAPTEEWEQSAPQGCEPDTSYHYDGTVNTGNGPTEGIVGVSVTGFLYTDLWLEQYSENYPVFSVNRDRKPLEGTDTEGDLGFMSRGEAIEAGQKFLMEKLGMEKVEILEAYSMRHEDMKKVQEMHIADDEKYGYMKEPTVLADWSEEDDAYLLYYEQFLGKLPIVSNPHSGEGPYVPMGTAELGLTARGVEYLHQDWNLEVTESRDEGLLPLEEIIKILEKKCAAFGSEKIIDTMKLVYYPILTSDSSAPYEYDFYPVWQFEFEDEYGLPIYINAVNGVEIMS